MTTLKDIALACNVSAMTVSDVLNGKSRAAAPATRERIFSAARQLNYRPHAVARSLRRRRTDIVGFYSGYGFTPLRSPFTAEIAYGLQSGCESQAKDLLMHGTFRGRSVDDIYGELVSGQIDGLILLAPPDDPLVGRLQQSELPTVSVADAVAGLPSVVVDDVEAGGLLARHLRTQGHRRAVFYTSSQQHVSAERRWQGFKAQAEADGLAVQAVPVDWRGLPAAGSAAPFAGGWTPAGSGGPTAAVCWNDILAYTLLEECDRQGVRVPQELAVAGFDGISPTYRLARQVTSVQMPWAIVAHTAVSLLVSQINGEEVPPETMLTVQFAPGDTG